MIGWMVGWDMWYSCYTMLEIMDHGGRVVKKKKLVIYSLHADSTESSFTED